VSDQSNSQPDYLDAIAELIRAGSDVAELVGIEWSAVPRDELLEKVQRWQRAVLQVATLNMQRSNEATENEADE
jgi:hypothetical protein